MNISHDGFYQSLAEHNRQAMNSWSYSMFDDLQIDDDDGEEWEEEKEDDDEPSREFTPEEIKEMSKNIQKMLKEGKERSDEIWKKMNIKNLQLPNYYAWLKS